MEQQQRTSPQRAVGGARHRLQGGQVVGVGSGPGELTVIDGRVWLTRHGDRDDHVLEGGQRMALAGDDDVLLEAWDAAAGATVRWLPAAQGFRRGGFAAAARPLALDWLARVAGRVALGLAALAPPFEATARRAASSARRAQGRICSGESMACGGTVQ